MGDNVNSQVSEFGKSGSLLSEITPQAARVLGDNHIELAPPCRL
jgi:hypothetical protein